MRKTTASSLTVVSMITTVLLLAVGRASDKEERGSAYTFPQPNGAHILVKRRQVYGGFELFEQRQKLNKGDPEAGCKYRWWYREDGVGIYDPDSPAVKTGTSELLLPEGRWVSFGPFLMEWSVNTADWGWIYFRNMPADEIVPKSIRLAFIDSDSFEGVDASDPRNSPT